LEARSGQRGAPVFDVVQNPGGDVRRPQHALAVDARSIRVLAFGAWALCALFPASPLALAAYSLPGAATTAAASAIVLETGRPLETSLAGGESLTYFFDLSTGRYARVEVEQRGIDVVATLISPRGETLLEADGPDGPHGTERASALAETAGEAGRFRLEVRSLAPTEPRGEVVVLLAEDRPSAPHDRDRLAAERAACQAVALWGQGNPDSLRGAIDLYKNALVIWQRLGERRYEAEAATNLGNLHRSLGEINRAAEFYESALPRWRELGETAREAELLASLGGAYGPLGESERAVALSTRAVELFRGLGDRAGEASALNTLGHAHLRAGTALDRVEELFERALALNRQAGERSGEGRSLSNLGMVRSRRGELKAAAEAYAATLEIARETEDRLAEAAALNNLSAMYELMGEPARSLERYHEVLRLVRELGDARGEAFALHNIGSLYKNFGEAEEGLRHLRSALELFERIGDRAAQAGTLDNIGWALLALDRPAEAIESIERGLEVARGLGDAWRESAALANLARAHRALGDGPRSLTLADQALAVARSAGLRIAEGNTLLTVGEVRIALGEPEEALEPLSRALAIYAEIGSRPAEAETLFRLARAERALGRLDDARRDLEAATERIESVRSAVANQDLRATYLASKQGYYEEWIGLLMELHRRRPTEGWDARALGVAERARARTLLDALAEVEAEVRTGLAPSLAAEEERLRHHLNARERDRRLAAAAGDETAAAAAAQDIRALAGEYRALEARIRNDSARYADLVQPEPLRAAAIQSEVLDPDTLLLQYSLGQRESWLWAVTRSSLVASRLAPRAEIESLSRRLYELLTARNLELQGETATDRARRIEIADAETPAAAAALADAVLGPVAQKLGESGIRRLVVVADGALHYVPFTALPKPGHRTGEPLLLAHEVVSVPSASALWVLRRELASRSRAPGALAVLADPVFDAADPRVVRRGETPESNHDDAARRGEGFRRLRFSRQEAEVIADLVRVDERLTAFDFAASRQTATDGLLAGYRMVHFATHGLLHADYPALSGLVLSLVDERGEPRDGFLRVHDIYGLELGADLVTLSACETALGREIRGEGLVGLARGFMYAGAARVVASLWSVQDRATAETMHRFYAGMLERGLPPAAALREAQIAMARQERWEAPYYWAPFVLHGEWR